MPPPNLYLMSRHYIDYIESVDSTGNPTFGTYAINGKDNAASARATQATNLANLALAKYQNTWNQQQQDRENVYNSPAQKLSRLLEAGLNPIFHDLEGVANSSQITSADMANQQAPSMVNSSTQRLAETMSSIDSLSGGVKKYIDSILAPQQLSLTKAQTQASIEKMHSESNVNREQVKKIQNSLKVDNASAAKLLSDIDVNNSNIQINHAKYEDLLSSVGERQAHEYLMKTQSEYLKKEGDERIKKMQSDMQLNEWQASKLNSEITKYAADLVISGQQIDANNLDNYMKWLEAQYKEMGLEQQYRENEAKIVQTALGYIAPVMNTLMTTLGGDIEKTEKSISKGVDPKGDWHPASTPNTSVPRPSWTQQ